MKLKEDPSLVSLEDALRKQRVKVLERRLEDNREGLRNLMKDHLVAHLAVSEVVSSCP